MTITGQCTFPGAPPAVATRFGDDRSRYDLAICNKTVGSSRLSHHFARILVITQADELRVSQMIRSRPFQKLYLRYGFRHQPQCRMPDYAAWLLPELPLLH
jgi:hypothetical protein